MTHIVRILRLIPLLLLALGPVALRAQEHDARHGQPAHGQAPERSTMEMAEVEFFVRQYEHLLPHERLTVLPKVWEALRPGGVLFLNQTPHRWYPIETHSTGLPLINYLPDRLAFAVARGFARSNTRGHTDQQLLRGGLRGATEREILGILAKTGHPAQLLVPQRDGCRDRIDLWHAHLNRERYRRIKAAMLAELGLEVHLCGTVEVYASGDDRNIVRFGQRSPLKEPEQC